MAEAPGEVFKQNVAFMQDYLRDKLEVCGVTLDLSPECLEGVYRGMLQNYRDRVRRVCPQISLRGLDLETLTEADLHTVWGAIEKRLPLPRNLRPPTTNPYTFLNKTHGTAAEDWIKLHLDIVRNLLCNARKHQFQFSALLCLSYWVFAFYSKKEETGDESYSKIAHYFHSDLVVTFIALEADYFTRRQFMPLYQFTTTTGIPEFKRDIICYGVTAQHSAFQRLVLLNVLKILHYATIDLTQLSPTKLARVVCNHFRGDGLSWSAKGVEGLLRIVKDQSRYMSVRSPYLQKNYVADKTRRHLSAIIQQYTFFVTLEDEFDWDALSSSIAVARQDNLHDDGFHLPPYPLQPPNTRIIQCLHHRVMHEICFKVIGEQETPRIDEHGWFEDVDTIEYITEVAFLVVNVVTQRRPQSEKTAFYHDLGLIVNYLQCIIAARWYLCECYPWRMAPTEDALYDYNILFLFIAFRVIVLYLLPQNPQKGVQKVAERLPDYAITQTFALPLPKLFEAFER